MQFSYFFFEFQNVEVVDSEPNPIRDSHHAGLLPHSPCSNSPEELVCGGGDQDVAGAAPGQSINSRKKPSLQLSVFESAESHPAITSSNVSQKNDIHHDDSLTLISSDFEMKEMGSSLVCKQPEIAHLKTQILYQERRIRDLQLQNQKLEAKSKELLALKALAETNGKLTKELKKLRALLTEQEQLAKKGAQAEVDRDLAREEMRALTAETTKLRAIIKSLEADLAKIKIANESALSDLKRKDDKINRLMADVQQAETSRELAYEEMKVCFLFFFFFGHPK
ncbi:unnamed protein product [Gongylonema pulchrum]|uniref:Uncharacterized protein n=1 Tax=Gongylonema pulchrum TaxID=637853 RepID=A0A3P7MP00_9BILA|nr:unnamed protein product [Gongylonema pulchrum]